jgi:cytosine deaminase
MKTLENSSFAFVWDMITTNPAKASGQDCTLKPGNPADFVLLDAETEFDALRRIAPRLLVIRAGQIVARTTPSETILCPKGWRKEIITFEDPPLRSH